MEYLGGNKDIGRRIKLLREKLRISQERLGELLGVSSQQVQKYEKGVNKVSAERLYRIAQALNVPLDFFLKGGRRADTKRKKLPRLTRMGCPFQFSPRRSKNG
jgi:transcriptional regulator with XRE-family HTH domain